MARARRKYTAEQKEAARAYVRQRKDRGVCACGRPTQPGRWRCEDCRIRTADWVNMTYWKRVNAGLCTYCGKNPVSKFRRCLSCRTAKKG